MMMFIYNFASCKLAKVYGFICLRSEKPIEVNGNEFCVVLETMINP